MPMSKEERKRLIEKAKEQKKIAQAIAEEKKIIANTPIHYMPTDPRLSKLPKKEAVEIINARREKVARGAALMTSEIEKEEKPEVDAKVKAKAVAKAKREAKAAAKKEEKDKKK